MNKHKQFIKDAYEGKYLTMCDKWKSEILKHYPEFEDDIQVGDWVIGKSGYLPCDFRLVSSVMEGIAMYNDPSLGEGENNGSSIKFIRKATPAEIETFLNKEAVRRGFKKGITMLCIEGAIGTEAKFSSDPDFEYSSTLDSLEAHFPNCTYTVYSKGKWAVPYEAITKEEAEKLLGKIIK